jgi:hypothetical protein
VTEPAEHQHDNSEYSQFVTWSDYSEGGHGGMIGDLNSPPPLPCENHVWGAPELLVNGQRVAGDTVQVCCVCFSGRVIK